MVISNASLDEYRALRADLDAVIEHAQQVSKSVEGLVAEDPNTVYAEQIFVSIIVQCMSLRRLMPFSSGEASGEVWDLPTCNSIARCIIDAHDAFLYIATANPIERGFRVILWELHAVNRSLKALKLLSSNHSKLRELVDRQSLLIDQLKNNSIFSRLNEEDKNKILKKCPQFYPESKDLYKSFGLNCSFREIANLHLSQYIHALPFAVHTLMEFRAGSGEALSQMSRSIQYVLPFLSRVVKDFRVVVPFETPGPDNHAKSAMDVWLGIYKDGLDRESSSAGKEAISQDGQN